MPLILQVVIGGLQCCSGWASGGLCSGCCGVDTALWTYCSTAHMDKLSMHVHTNFNKILKSNVDISETV